MDPICQTNAETDARLVQVLDEYFAALQAGTAPSKHELMSRHPDLADDLEICLGSLDFIRRASVKPAAGEIEPTEGQPFSGDAAHTGMLGDYRILREIGRGGMGIVYEAEQVSLGRRVALKVLPFAVVLDPKQLQRFKNEAHLAAQLHYNNIVPVFSVGCERGVHYYAMQYIEGQTLAAVIEELRQLDTSAPSTSSSIPGATRTSTSSTVVASISTERCTRSSEYFRTAARLGVQVAQALEHAHEMGVIHRDIKPSNLLVDARGKVWITDFGLAQFQSDAGLTMTGDLLGTIRYMSPEQALAKRATVDHRTDIYSLAVTLYELLTLEPAVPGDDRHELLRKITFEEPRLPRRINKFIPAELEIIVLKALSKNPLNRYGTAQEFADDLERFMDDKPIQAKRPSLVERATKFARRHRAGLWTAAAMMLLISLGSIVSTALLLKAQSTTGRALASSKRNLEVATIARRTAEENEQLAKAAALRAATAEREKALELLKSYLAQARAGRRSRQPGQQRDSLAALTNANRLARTLQVEESNPLLLRNEAVACLMLPDLKLTQRLQPGDGLTPVCMDDQLQRYACVNEKGDVTVFGIGHDEPLVELPGPGSKFGWTQFSPDGQHLVVQYWNWESWLWDVKTGSVVLNAPLAPSTSRAYSAFTPDGRLLGVAEPDNSIHFYAVATGEAVRTLAIDNEFHEYCFEPSGKLLAIALPASNEIQIWDFEAGTLRLRIPHPGSIFSLAWRPDRKILASGGNDTRIYLWNATTGEQCQTLRGHRSSVTSLAFHPDGRMLVSNAWDGTTRIWDAATGTELLRLSGWTTPRFRADGLQIGFLGGHRELSIWDWAGSRVLTNFGSEQPIDEEIESLDFSPDDRILAASSRSGARLWDVSRGAESALLKSDRVRTPLFHGPSESLLTSGSSGLQRWPICLESESQVRIGPPQTLSSLGGDEPGNHDAAISQDGRWAAVIANERQVLVLNLKNPIQRLLLDGHDGVHHVAISPKGEWVVTGARFGRDVKLWDTRSGSHVQDLWQGEMHAIVEFSPDGRLLIANSGREFRVWETGSWKHLRSISREGALDLPGPIALTDDSAIVALARSRSSIELIQTHDWQSLLTLETPDSAHFFGLRFSHDGARLAASSRSFVHVWDLRRIREALADMELDWAAPRLPPAHNESEFATMRVELPPDERPRAAVQPATDPTAGIQGQVQRRTDQIEKDPRNFAAYYYRGIALTELKRTTEAEADFRRALELASERLAETTNNGLAFHIRAHVHEELGQRDSALSDYTAALDLQPDDPHILISRARLHRHLKHWDDAIADYSRVAEINAKLPEPHQSLAELNRELNRPAKAIAHLETLVQLRPKDARSMNVLAWLYVAGPVELRNPKRSVELAQKAVELAPWEWNYWNTLGVALYRGGQFEPAIHALQESAVRSPNGVVSGSVASNWFFLAMSYHQLGDTPKASACYNQATQWIDLHPTLSNRSADEVATFRQEAATLLAVGRQEELASPSAP